MDDRVMQFRVGVMVFATLIIAGILVVRLGELPTLRSYEINVWFSEATDVSEGTPVYKNGIRIGRVTRVRLAEEFPDSEHDYGVIVTAEIDRDRRIYPDEDCWIKVSLMGDSSLEFTRQEQKANPPHSVPGDGAMIPPDRALLATGATGPPQGAASKREPFGRDELSEIILKGKKRPVPGDVINELQGTLDRLVDKLTGTLDEMKTPILEATRSLADASTKLGDAADGMNMVLTEENTQRLANTLEGMNKLFGEKESQERLATVVRELPLTLNKMGEVVNSAHDVILDIKEISGPLARDSEQRARRIDNVVRQLDETTAQLSHFSQQLNSREGTLGRLIHDRDLYDHLSQTAENLDTFSRQLKPIVNDFRVFSDKIARHPGILVRDAVRPGIGIK